MNDPDKIIRVTLTLTEDINDRIRDLAKHHDRPLSREIRRALEAHLEANEDRAA